jgi:hypothetical protein
MYFQLPASPSPQARWDAWLSYWDVAGGQSSSDVDGDGVPLILEYAFGGDPYADDGHLLPVITVDDGYLQIEVTKSRTPTDLIYFVQSSRDLVPNSWTTSGVEVLDEDGQHILARCKKPISEQPLCFLRVRVLLMP